MMLPITGPTPSSQRAIISQEHLQEFVTANADQFNDNSVLELVVLLVRSPTMQPVLEAVIMGLRQHDFLGATKRVIQLFNAVADCLIALCQDVVSQEASFRKRLRRAARRLGYKIHHYARQSLQMPNGTYVKVSAAWFKVSRRNGRRKRGPKQAGSACKGRHLGLEFWGYFKNMCPILAFKALSLGALCPSMARASQVLKNDGICVSQNKIRDLLSTFDDLTDDERARLSCKADETVAGRRLCILIDAGRTRERAPRRGRIPKDKKRRPFDTPWRAPLLFTLFIINEDGNIDEPFPIVADGVLTHWQKVLPLMEAYLKQLHADQAKEIIIIGDGDENIWQKVPALVATVTERKVPVVEILDYYHAADYLHDLFKLPPNSIFTNKEALMKQAKEALFEGRIDDLYSLLAEQGGRGNKRELSKRLTSYFIGNRTRMRYQAFRSRYPIGSGQIESAVRSIINLRIKSPSTYWYKAKAETMIFLRSKLLYGRWQILRDNWLKARTDELMASYSEPIAPLEETSECAA